MSDEYFYDTKTGEVTQGRQTGWRHRMGPYATRGEAEKALEIAAGRNESWDGSQGPGTPEGDDD
ncbi:SPOR domain-containing protein [Cellulomonas sp. PhB143]|uniref:SPOR domain-containing protein n=1 Tax=Cellulomonas sp. PhB143 TaxID=2485186 RepID=UPI000F4ACA87|nr:SPOR domain-containing protein [Cellulomonas sp. PhB143]ROS73057.1 sporulation related protein [Cellulomonas sp. PhB143]